MADGCVSDSRDGNACECRGTGGGITPKETAGIVDDTDISEKPEDELEIISEEVDDTALEKENAKEEIPEKTEIAETAVDMGEECTDETEKCKDIISTADADSSDESAVPEEISDAGITNEVSEQESPVLASNDAETKEVSYNIVLDPSEVTLKEGETCKLSVSMEPEEPKEVVYTFSTTNNGSVAFDEETMTITAVGAGKGTVRVTAAYKKENGVSASTSRSCTVNVEKAVGDTEILINGTPYLVADAAEKSNLQQAVEAAGITDYRNITSIEFRNGVIRKDDFTYISSIEAGLNYGLQSFIIDDSVQVKGLIDNAVPNAAFKTGTTSYPKLTTVYLGINIKKIEKQAFYGCSAITSFDAPGVEYIGSDALNRIKVPTLRLPSVTRLDEDAFGTMDKNMTTELYLPCLSTMGTSGAAYDALECFTGLQKLTLGSNPPKLTKALKLGNGVAESLELVLPRGAVSNYQTGEYYDAAANTWCGIKLPVQEQYVVTVSVNGEIREIILPYEYKSLGDLMPETPEKDGYVFLEWNTSEDGSGEYVTEDTPINGDITIYAVFRQEYVYNITFIIDGKEINTQVAESDGTLVLPDIPEKDGYIFKGWNTKADGTGNVVTDGMPVTSDMVIYAVFEKKSDAGKDDSSKNENGGKENNVTTTDKKEDKKADDERKTSKTKAVQTGDNTTTVPAVLSILVSGAVVAVLSVKKNYKK